MTKFRSVADAGNAGRFQPETPEFRSAVRAIHWMAVKFAPPLRVPPGVYKFRSIEEAAAFKEQWKKRASRGC